jgi:large subunit ribosomal protein L29
MKVREMRELGVEELEQHLREQTKEYNDLRLKHKSGGTIEKPVRLRTMRHDIARINTILGEKRRAK